VGGGFGWVWFKGWVVRSPRHGALAGRTALFNLPTMMPLQQQLRRAAHSKWEVCHASSIDSNPPPFFYFLFSIFIVPPPSFFFYFYSASQLLTAQYPPPPDPPQPFFSLSAAVGAAVARLDFSRPRGHS
jgi:hypothetical protein